MRCGLKSVFVYRPRREFGKISGKSQLFQLEKLYREKMVMNTLMLFTGSGPIVILTSHGSIKDPALLEKLKGKGIDKFIAYEIPLALAESRYGGHFQVVTKDLRESDDLRVLDFNGERAFRLFRLSELGTAIMHEEVSQPAEAG